jgi:hypothetical protein
LETNRTDQNGKSSFFTWSTLIGLLLIITGVVFLVNPDNLRLKVGAGLLLFGVFSIFLVNIDEKSIPKIITGRRLTLILVLWVFLGLLFTYNIDADVFLVVVILGILILIELLSYFMSPLLKKRNTILFYLLIIAFLVVVEQSIVNHLFLK